MDVLVSACQLCQDANAEDVGKFDEEVIVVVRRKQ